MNGGGTGRAERAATTGLVALGAALLTYAVPRADPADPATLLGLGLAAAALVASVAPRSSDGRPVLAFAAGAAVTAAAVGHPATATITERDVRIGAIPLVLPLLVAAMIRSPRLATVAVAGGLLAGPVRALVYDPFLDPHCASCAPGRLVVWAAPDLAATLRIGGLLTAVIAVLLTLAVQRAPAELVAAAAALAAYAVGMSDPAALAGAVLAILWLARTKAVAWHRRREVRRLLSELDRGDDLTSVLRRSLDDAELVVTFPDGDRFVDRLGTVTVAERGQATTDLRVEGRVLARIHHAPGARVPEVATGLDGPARLALTNERMTAQLAARVGELTRARAAVVENGIRERRTLERDLHDGVQQDLLALGLDLRVAASRLGADDPHRLSLDAAVADVRDALDEVRDISHGAYPPLLATRGLAAASASLARRTSATVDVGQVPDDRLPDPVERAAFAVVAEAVDRGADRIFASVGDGRLVIRAEGAGPGADGILPDLVAAVGGELDLGETISAVIPCG